MKKFTLIKKLIILWLITLTFVNGTIAQLTTPYPLDWNFECQQPLNISDSLEIIKILGTSYPLINFIDTLGECRVESLYLLDYSNQHIINGQFNLPFLKILVFDGLSLSNISDYDIPSLEELYINSPSNVNSEVPEFSNLPELRLLYINDTNSFGSGAFGNIPNFSNLKKLEILVLSGSEFDGDIPKFDNLPNLKYLSLRSNNLSGEIPDFDNFPHLKF